MVRSQEAVAPSSTSKKSPAGAGLIQGCERRSIMDRTEICLPTYGYSRASSNFLVFGSFSALKPSLGHSVPRRLAGRISRGLRHLLALGGVSQKFVSWIDGSHGRSLLGFPSPPETILMADRARQPALDTVKPGIRLCVQPTSSSPAHAFHLSHAACGCAFASYRLSEPLPIGRSGRAPRTTRTRAGCRSLYKSCRSSRRR